MERGLLWLPLLGLFLGLFWAGWNEFQKVEGYRVWAAGFDRAKYDIRSALGQKGDELTWGVPSRKGLIDRQSVSLATIDAVQLRVDGQVVNFAKLPDRGARIELELVREGQASVLIPFTEVPLAAQWATALAMDLVG
jgi:hypothetical protein